MKKHYRDYVEQRDGINEGWGEKIGKAADWMGGKIGQGLGVAGSAIGGAVRGAGRAADWALGGEREPQSTPHNADLEVLKGTLNQLKTPEAQHAVKTAILNLKEKNAGNPVKAAGPYMNRPGAGFNAASSPEEDARWKRQAARHKATQQPFDWSSLNRRNK